MSDDAVTAFAKHFIEQLRSIGFSPYLQQLRQKKELAAQTERSIRDALSHALQDSHAKACQPPTQGRGAPTSTLMLDPP
jgi:hypothetical protein